jgi:hypothetical protein
MTPEAWADAVWLLGERAYRLWLGGETEIALDEPPQSTGSALAREVAAKLIASRGGDALERAAFAFLFAAGEPQEGLRAFLEKRKPRF